ncbi:zinc finger protein, partial [Cricetulus griseus]
ESVSFEDVAVNFTPEEWALLNSSQKRLHRDVMQETFRNLAAIAKKQEDQTLEDDYEYLRKILPIAVQTGYKPCENQEYAEKPGTNKECGKVFSSPQCFLEHVTTQMEEKTYECKQTKEGFSRHSYVQIPERIHDTEESCVLKQCGKDFLTLTDTQQHITHNGHEPYICKVCGKAFLSSSSFLTHERTHTGEQLYTCKQCGKTFTYSSGLRRHERTHSGEKPYKCKQFLKVFPSLSKVESHEQTHNGIKY